MSDVRVAISQDNAILLLDAADKAGEDPAVVRTSDNWFVVDEDIAKDAGVEYEVDEDEKAELAAERAAKKAATAQRRAAAKKSGE
jgi:hypothetical protein